MKMFTVSNGYKYVLYMRYLFQVCIWLWLAFLTVREDIICGASSHKALAQDSGSWELHSSLMMITTDSTS